MKEDIELLIDTGATNISVDIGGLASKHTISLQWWEGGEHCSLEWTIEKLYSIMSEEPKMRHDIRAEIQEEYKHDLRHRQDLIDRLGKERQILLDKVDALVATISIVKKEK